MGEGVTIMQAALDLAARGFRVFPLVPGHKGPAFEGWKAAATTDPQRIAEWWSGTDGLVVGFTKAGDEVMANARFNVGVACGGGLLGLDADVKKGKDGINVARALGVAFDGFVVRTPSGGLHEYLRGPDVANSVGTGSSGLGDGVDIRSAGGFLVGPGSVVDGVAYTLEAANEPRAVPPAVIQRLVAPVERRNTDAVVIADRPDAVARGIDYLAQAPVATEGDAGDVTTFKVAAHLKDFGVGEDMAAELMAEHWNDRCSPPWPIDELKLKVRNAYEYGVRPLGDLHPLSDFRDVRLTPAPTPIREGRSWFHHGEARGVVDWLYYQMLPKTGVGVLVAPTGAGKTFLLLELARCTATGKPFFKEVVDDRGATLFLFAGTEGSGLGLRMDALGEAERLPISATIVGNLSDRDALPAILADLRLEADRIMAEFGLPVRLIVLETLAASGLLEDENDNSEASRAMTNLATIGREMGAFVMTSHHPSKDGKDSRGASAIPNSADYRLEVTVDGNIRELSLKKARDAEQRKLGTFTLLPIELGRDSRDRPITSMTISTGEVMSNAVRQAAHSEMFLEALGWAIMEQGEMVNGRLGVEESVAREVFKEWKPGSKDRSNVGKAFKVARQWCEQIGRVDAVAHAGETFLILKDQIEVAA